MILSLVFKKGILLNPTDNNICYKHSQELNNREYCSCNKTCIKCKDNQSEILPVIILENNQFKSKRCNDFIYSAFSFNGVKMG